MIGSNLSRTSATAGWHPSRWLPLGDPNQYGPELELSLVGGLVEVGVGWGYALTAMGEILATLLMASR